MFFFVNDLCFQTKQILIQYHQTYANFISIKKLCQNNYMYQINVNDKFHINVNYN